MPDSEEQELNCKIIVGKVSISNVDDFLSSLKNIAHKYAVIIQAMDAELIAGEEHIIRDFLAGIFIIIEDQYRVGDVVNIANVGGLVQDISLRKTVLRDLDGREHHIANGEIRKASNLSKEFSGVNLNIGVAYKENLEHVIEVVNRVGKELAEEPQWKDKIITTPQFLRVDDFADSAIIIKILGDTKTLKQWEVKGELRKRLKIAFDEEDIEIPFPQMSVWPRGKWE